MTARIIPSLDSSEGDPEYVRVENCAHEVVHVSVMKAGQEIGVYVNRGDLLRAVGATS